jgi:CRP-like cAMP-binding protein
MTTLTVVPAEQPQLLPQPLTCLRVRTSEHIPLPENYLWMITSGLVVTCTSYLNGDMSLLGLLGPEDLLGRPLTGIDPYTAIALTPVYLSAYSWSDLEPYPALARPIWLGLVRRQRQAEALLAALGERRVEDRLWALLQLLAQDFGEVSDRGTRLRVRLTHQQLADLLCTTRVTVTRILGRWFAQGHLLRTQDRHFVVPAA